MASVPMSLSTSSTIMTSSATINSQFLIDATTRGPAKIVDTSAFVGHQVTGVPPVLSSGLESATTKIAATNVMSSATLSSGLSSANQSLLTGPGLSQADPTAHCYSNAIANVPGYTKSASALASASILSPSKGSGNSTRSFGKPSSEIIRTKVAEASGAVKPVFASASRKFFKSEKKLETTKVRIVGSAN